MAKGQKAAGPGVLLRQMSCHALSRALYKGGFLRPPLCFVLMFANF